MKTNFRTLFRVIAVTVMAFSAAACTNDEGGSSGGGGGNGEGGGDTPEPEKGIFVTFDTQGGSALEKTEIWQEGIFCPVPYIPKKEGQVFQGWYKDAAASEDQEFDLTANRVRQSITLYAKWVPANDETYLEQVNNIFIMTDDDAAANRLTVMSDYNTWKYITVPAETKGRPAAVSEMAAKIESLGSYSFANKMNAVAVFIPGTVKTVGASSFTSTNDKDENGADRYSGIRTVWIDEGVERIENNAFNGCRQLEKVHISSSVNFIGIGAFANHNGAVFELDQSDPEAITLEFSEEWGGLNFVPAEGSAVIIRVPESAVDAYKKSANWTTDEYEILFEAL